MKRFNMKFNRKISLYFFSISMLIVFILFYFNYNTSVKIIKQNIQNNNQQQIKTTSIYIASYLEKIKATNTLLSMNPEIIASLDNKDQDNKIINIINLTKSSDKVIKNILIVSKKGRLICNSNSSMSNKENVLDEKWYQEALNSNNMAQITTENHTGFTMDKNERVISVSHEIYDENKELVGLSIIDISYDFIEDYISTLNLGESGFAYIFDENNNLIFDSTQMNNNSLKEKPEYIDILNNFNDKNDEYLKSTIYIPNTEWSLTQVSGSEKIQALNKKLISEMLLWAILISLLSIAISIFVSKKITNPIVKLMEEMNKVSNKFNNIKLNKSASIEVKELTKEYNLLLDRIKKLTKDIETKENIKRAYELKSLQSQINPHFIYNTLETIIWLIEFNENEKAIQVIQDLGTILRNTLNIEDSLTELKNELNHVRSYMDIQKVRYYDKFDYEFEIDPNTEEIKIPKLIIQPLVENSIYHGVKPKENKSYIKIKSFIKNDDLIIVIEDNGLGFNVETLNKNKLKLGGIGMSNVDQILKILYGESYGLNYATENGITKVSVKIKI